MYRGQLKCSVCKWGHWSWFYSNRGSKSGKWLLDKSGLKTKEKEAVFESGKVECNDPTKETTIVYEFLLTVDSLQNRLQKVTPVYSYRELLVVEENDPKEWLHMNSE